MGWGGLGFWMGLATCFSGENCTPEGNFRLPDPVLRAVEDDAMLAGHLHKLNQVSVMLLRVTAIYAYISVWQ